MIPSKIYDVIVIGAGQAGLAAGYFLQQTKLSFLLIDQNTSIGQSWKERYDSLKLFTPNVFNALPGLNFPAEPNDYAVKDEIAAYLQMYAKKFNLPVRLQNHVTKLEKNDTIFTISGNKTTYFSRSVIVATGHQKLYIPSFASSLNQQIVQLHTAAYKNPSQIPGGKILVVGMGNSGVQIAVELSQNHEVTISSWSKPKYFSYPSLGKNWFWLIKILGLLMFNIPTVRWPVSALVKKFREPIIGLDGVKLKKLLQSGKVKLKPAVVEAADIFVQFADNSQEHFRAIIWATGFKDDFSWLSIRGSLDAQGEPIQRQGISPIQGLYFVGLKFQTILGSGVIPGAGSDARFVIKKLRENL